MKMPQQLIFGFEPNLTQVIVKEMLRVWDQNYYYSKRDRVLIVYYKNTTKYKKQ